MSKALGVLRRSRRFTLLTGMVVLLALSFLVTQPPVAMTAVLKPQSCTYYSDATYTTVVGYAVLYCNGSFAQLQGKSSAYRICENDYCCGSVWC
jgi:hypothetical protein